MDQSAFRNMLSRPRTVPASAAPGVSLSTSRPRNLLAGGSSTSTKAAPAAAPAQASFKPRKIKDAPKLADSEANRSDDRGALDDIARMVDSLRSGGPSAGPAGAAEDLDASLEAAFETSKPASPPPPAPVAGKKRTREDIIRELRGKGAESASPDPMPDRLAEGTGKGFKSIGKKVEGGFKPIGEKKKKKKVKAVDAEGAKAIAAVPAPVEKTSLAGETEGSAVEAESQVPPGPQEPVVDMDDDIFAGAGTYEGYDLSSDEEGETGESSKPGVPPPASVADSSAARAKANWFNEPSRSPSPPPVPGRPTTPPPQPTTQAEEGEEEEDIRLRPLESSSIPSIRELLSMDKEEEARAKKRAKKDAWRAKQGLGPSQRDEGDWSDEEERKKKKKKGGVESEYNKLQKYMT